MITPHTPFARVIRALRIREERRQHNCRTCRHGGPDGRDCFAMTLDEDADQPILDWLQAAPMADDGSVPAGADGCPGWEPR